MRTNWTIILNNDAFRTAIDLAKGTYQRALLRGVENLSGSTLQGKARSYAGHYARSRANLLRRCKAAGVVLGERKGDHGARLLVIGAAS